MQQAGGSMDTSKYHMLLQASIHNYQLVGFLVSIIGILGLIWGMYLLIKGID